MKNPMKHIKIPQTPMGVGLRMLNQFSGSQLANQFGLREYAEKLMYHGMKTVVKTGTIAQSQFQSLKKILPKQELSHATPANVFDLTLSDEQQMICETIHEFADQQIKKVARQADEERTVPEGFFKQCQDVGLNLLAIPEALDGAGTSRSPVTSVLMAEELAKGDMSLALAALAPLGVINALNEFGSLNQQSHYLPNFAGEEFVAAAIALMEPKARFNPDRLETKAVKTPQGYVITGEKCMVPLGAQCKLLLVVANLSGEGPKAFLVETHAEGISFQEERHMGLHATGMSRVKLNNVTVAHDALLGEQEKNYDHQKLLDLCHIGLCALAVGTCQAVLDYTIDYANAREAFGEPISHRQAVAFMIADIATELEAMRMMTYRAASRAEQGLDFHREAYLARIFCADKAMEIGTNGVQLLGGHGFVCEHPVELWYRQLRAIGILEGGYLV
ncbi:MAG: acyl-CoA dehydrogenase family protein [SAR324 cluster bacterium]|nr:acyl-CoA dehydrogenase family protein [SAR324 cluster bacterium]